MTSSDGDELAARCIAMQMVDMARSVVTEDVRRGGHGDSVRAFVKRKRKPKAEPTTASEGREWAACNAGVVSLGGW